MPSETEQFYTVKLGICSEVPSREDYLSGGRGHRERLAFYAFVNALLSDLPKFTEEIATGYLRVLLEHPNLWVISLLVCWEGLLATQAPFCEVSPNYLC